MANQNANTSLKGNSAPSQTINDSIRRQEQPGSAPQAPSSAPISEQRTEKAVMKRFVSVESPIEEVIRLNNEGAELYFESERGKFLQLTESQVRELSNDNRVRYGVSLQLHAKSDPENDRIQQRLKILGANSRRKEFEKTVKGTLPSALATKKLQTFVGDGFHSVWTRGDKIESRLELGYEFVKPGDDVYVGVPATDGHFETKVETGKTELTLMRIPLEKKAEIDRMKKEKADRLLQAGDEAGRSELRALGAKPVTTDDGSINWVDRI